MTGLWGPAPGSRPAGTARRPRRLALLFGLLLCLAAANGVTPAPASAATTLEVAAGWSGFNAPGRAVPVRVTVTADRLLHGDLLATTIRGRRQAVRLPVEVAGGSVKRFVLLLPPGTTGQDGDVKVELRSEGRTLARGTAPLRWTSDGTELVGLLPGVLAGRPVPASAPLAVDAGVAQFSALEPADLSRGPFAIESLGTIGLAPQDLAGLAPSARTGLLAWVGAGGRLLVDGVPGDAVPGLPAEWTPGPSRRASAGQGEIRLTGDTMATGRWEDLVEPTPLGRNVSPDSFFSGDMVANSVAVDAGLHLPGLATVLGFLALYVLAVGPLTAVMLRRWRRPELAWVVVPVLAVAFTVVSYAAGTSARGGTHVAHGSVVQTQGNSAVATTFVGLSRSGAGSAQVGFPAGWTLRPAGSNADGSGLPTVNQADGAPEAELPLDLGQFGFVKASGPARLPGALEVTAAAEGTGGRGTVRNRLPYALDDVAVFLGTGVAGVGRLEAGAERTWSITEPFAAFDPGLGREWFRRFPGDVGSDGALGPDGPVNLALWQATRAELGGDLSAPGAAVAVGWTRSFRPDIRLDGKARSIPGRTALVARATVTAPPGSVPAVAVGRQVLRGPFPTNFGWDGWAGPDGATVLRFTLPQGGNTSRPLVLRSTVALQSVEVWRDGGWQQLGPAGVNLLPIPGAKGGFRVFPQAPFPRAVPPPPPLAVPPPPTGAGPGSAIAVPMPVPVPTTFPVDGGGLGGDAVFPGGAEVPIPEATASDGVIFVRVTANFFEGPGGASVTVGEAG